MRISSVKVWFTMMVVVSLCVLVMGGCAAKINHSYDTGMNFTDLKRYKWGATSALTRQHSLVGTNVQTLADQILQEKGFTKSPENPDFMILIDYDYDIGMYRYGNQLRMLSLSIYRADKRDLIWRGIASGTINTNTESSDLKNVVKRILLKFPPSDPTKSPPQEKPTVPVPILQQEP